MTNKKLLEKFNDKRDLWLNSGEEKYRLEMVKILDKINEIESKKGNIKIKINTGERLWVKPCFQILNNPSDDRFKFHDFITANNIDDVLDPIGDKDNIYKIN